LFAALSAGSGIHLAGTSITIVPTISTIPLCFPGTPTSRTTLGLIGELFGSVKFLLFNRESKGFAAIGAL